MKFLKLTVLKIAMLAGAILSACWHVLLFLVDLIDGGEDESNEVPTDNIIRYNYRSGDIDPVKRIDGLYHNDWR